MVSEKVGGAEGTKLDDDFKDLERVTHTYTVHHNNVLERKYALLVLWKLSHVNIYHS